MARKNTTEGLIPIGNFNFGGLADSKFSGIKNSLFKLTGWDLHSVPGLLRVAQKMTAETTGIEPDELCKERVASSNGSQFWFSATSGKIWERPTSGTWRLVHTTTPAAGAAGCLGAAEYQGYIYWATQSRLHRITVANSDNNDWTTDAVEDWATFGVTNASFHPMYETPGQVLYIGDGNQVAQVDAGTFSANALDIRTPLIIKCLGGYGTDLLIGTYIDGTVNQVEIIRWNTWNTDSFQSSDPIPEVSVNAFLPGDNIVFAQCGVAGRIYVYNGEKLELFKTIPGDYSPTATAEVYPSSVANIGGDIYFGVSNITGNPCDQGIYRFGRYSKDYPYVLDLPYPISERSGSDFVLTGLNIGGIVAVGTILYASWKNDAGADTYGVDKLDYTLKLDGAYFETRIMIITREKFANFAEAVVAYFSLPASCNIDMYLDRNHAGMGAALTKVNDEDRNIFQSVDEGAEFSTLRLKVKATTSANTGPEIESAGIFAR